MALWFLLYYFSDLESQNKDHTLDYSSSPRFKHLLHSLQQNIKYLSSTSKKKMCCKESYIFIKKLHI